MVKIVTDLGATRFCEGSIFFEKISKNIIDTEKMPMTNIIENFVADNIVFGTEVLAHHPEELPLEIWEFTNFHWVSGNFFWI